MRKALNEAHNACTTAHESGLADLEATAAWQALTPDQRFDILSSQGIRQMPEIAVGTTEEVLRQPRRTTR